LGSWAATSEHRELLAERQILDDQAGLAAPSFSHDVAQGLVHGLGAAEECQEVGIDPN
jgi:hypothetical protein